MKKVVLLFRVLNRKFQTKFDKFIEAEPMVASECVARTVNLLRRDFPINVQNEIVVSVIHRLNEQRDKDIVQKQIEFDLLKEHTQSFKEKIVC